jgi:hypothetical protein
VHNQPEIPGCNAGRSNFIERRKPGLIDGWYRCYQLGSSEEEARQRDGSDDDLDWKRLP